MSAGLTNGMKGCEMGKTQQLTATEIWIVVVSQGLSEWVLFPDTRLTIEHNRN